MHKALLSENVWNKIIQNRKAVNVTENLNKTIKILTNIFNFYDYFMFGFFD